MKIHAKYQWSNLEAVIAIAVNTLLFAVKLWAGTVSGSIGIVADAWHTLSDSFSSGIILIGVRISRKPPDHDHPYGHGRAEIVSAVIIGTLLSVIGFNFLLESIQRFGNHQAAVFTNLSIIVIIVSIITKELMAQFAFWCARKTESELLRADGWHHRSDALSSMIILIGIFLGKYFWWIDSILGIAMSLFLFFASYKIMRSSISKLLGESLDNSITDSIIETINQIAEDNVEPHHFHCHTYGDHKEISFHIMLDPQLKIKEAHELVDRMEDRLRQYFNIEATIHIDPKRNYS
ncbi:cation diffusion facilitator family transporter [Candidatus Cloacimonadota bacterium]